MYRTHCVLSQKDYGCERLLAQSVAACSNLSSHGVLQIEVVDGTVVTERKVY